MIFLAGFIAGSWFFNGGGQNQNATFDLARALVEQRTIVVDDYRDNTIDLSFRDGHYYINKAPGLSWIAAPLYALTLPLDSLDLSPGLELTLAQYLVTAAINGTSLGIVALLIWRFGLRFGVAPRWAATIAILTATATPLLAYASMLFTHLPSAALLLASLFWVTAVPARPLAAGVAASIAGSMNYLMIPGALVPMALLWWQTRGGRPLLHYLAGAAPFALLTLAYHSAAFGSPFSTAIDHTNPEFISEGAPLGVISGPSIEALWGITFSPYRGLFFLSPFLLLAFVGIRKLPRPVLAAIATLITGFVIFNISFNGWHGGYTIGPRYVLPIVPLLALGLLMIETRFLRVAVVALGLSSLFLNLAATAVDPQVPETIENPVFEYILPTLISGVPPEREDTPWLHEFFTGHVGVNRLTVSERQIYRKFPPGSRETEWAAFNLGEALTSPGSLFSLLPLLLLELALLLYLRRLIRQSPALSPDPPPR